MLILCSLFCITLISWVIHGKFQIVWAVQSLWRQGQVCGSSDVVGKNPNKTGNTIHKCSFTCWGLKLKWFSGITHKYSTGINLWICVNLSVKCKKKKKSHHQCSRGPSHLSNYSHVWQKSLKSLIKLNCIFSLDPCCLENVCILSKCLPVCNKSFCRKKPKLRSADDITRVILSVFLSRARTDIILNSHRLCITPHD